MECTWFNDFLSKDFWYGGYVEINGVKYCEDFNDGQTQTVDVNWAQILKSLKEQI